MRLLLDTHTLLWWLDGNRRMSKRARALVGRDTNEVFVSAASRRSLTARVLPVASRPSILAGVSGRVVQATPSTATGASAPRLATEVKT